MNDCSNAEIRDQLPDLLHDRLPVSARSEVLAHIDDCVDCRDELELLRCMQNVMATRAPRVDVASVVGALPKPPAHRATVVPIARPRRTWVDWRIAAAVTFLAVGGASVAIVNRDGAPDVETRISQVVTDSPSTLASREPATVATTDEPASGGLRMGGRLADLDDQQLQALIDEIEQMKAVPITEPEPVSIKVDSKITLPEDGT